MSRGWRYPWRLETLPEGEPDASWTPRQLDEHATRLIEAGQGDWREGRREHGVMTDQQIHTQRRREILSEQGTPDPGIQRGMFHRSHPQGRRVNGAKARAYGAGFYHSP